MSEKNERNGRRGIILRFPQKLTEREVTVDGLYAGREMEQHKPVPETIRSIERCMLMAAIEGKWLTLERHCGRHERILAAMPADHATTAQKQCMLECAAACRYLSDRLQEICSGICTKVKAVAEEEGEKEKHLRSLGQLDLAVAKAIELAETVAEYIEGHGAHVIGGGELMRVCNLYGQAARWLHDAMESEGLKVARVLTNMSDAITTHKSKITNRTGIDNSLHIISIKFMQLEEALRRMPAGPHLEVQLERRKMMTAACLYVAGECNIIAKKLPHGGPALEAMENAIAAAIGFLELSLAKGEIDRELGDTYRNVVSLLKRTAVLAGAGHTFEKSIGEAAELMRNRIEKGSLPVGTE